MATTKYFRVVATDNVPNFEATSQWAGVWSGVAEVDDEVIQQRLIDAGKQELTQEEYDAELKKKQGMQGRFHDWREVAGSAVGMVAKPAVPAEQSRPAPASQPDQISVPQETIQAAAIPKPRAKSVQKPA